MTAANKSRNAPRSCYEIAAEIHRAKIVANHVPHPDEIVPVNGRLHVALSGEALTREHQRQLFGESRIDIPEFAQERVHLKHAAD